VTLVDADRQWFKARYGFDTEQTPRDESFCAHAILEPRRLMLVEDTLRDARFVDHPAVTGELGVRFYAGVPLLDGEGLPLGSLCVFDDRPGTLSGSQAEALRALARQAAHLIELRRAARELDRHMRDRDWYEQQLTQYSDLLEQQNADLAEQTRTDPLTGLPNRRVWDEDLERELARARRHGGTLCLAMIDLDRFKAFNDHHGHQAGDRLLATAAAAWRPSLRATDTLARYGGEEFAVLLPHSDHDAARTVVERLLGSVPLGQTASAGIAQWDGQESAEALLARADAALYAAKGAGRARAVTAA
jgi:diguanylate cyclase (GGDEF)-like protein